MTKNIYLSFASGYSFEKIASKNIIKYKKIYKIFDEYKVKTLGDIDKTFLNENHSILNQKRGCGYWLWKPYFIKNELENMKENDILFYCDSGREITINPQNLITSLIKNHDKYFIVFTQPEKQKEQTKGDVLNYFNCTAEEQNYKQIWGGVIIIKNNIISRNIIDKWLQVCKIKHLIDDTPSNITNKYMNITGNRHDQSIFSMVIYKNIINCILLSRNEENMYFKRKISIGYTLSKNILNVKKLLNLPLNITITLIMTFIFIQQLYSFRKNSYINKLIINI
jgi:hypothetical protein